MTDRTVKDFLELVQRSQLVSADHLQEALRDFAHTGAAEAATDVANHLRSKGLITAWQQQNLLAGKSKGFFLGGYTLLEHLGTGGMSSVFLARHPLVERRVAIKVLPSSRNNQASFLDRLFREARAIAQLSHPNIIRAYDIDQQGNTYFMVMEYVSGRDLKVIVNGEGPLSLERAAYYIAQAANGLQHAHARGLIHRDIKPANLLVNDSDVVKILDMGLARLEDDELSTLTVDNSESMMGTADYLSPEQARNAHDVDGRADIYSLGCTFYYLLTGHAPFTEGTIAQRILKHQSETPRDVRAEREDCPHALADVCMTMLAKDPHDRFPEAKIVANRLQRWLQQQGSYASSRGTGTTPALPLVRSSISIDLVEQTSMSEDRKARQRPHVRTPIWLWWLLGVSTVVCVILLVYLLVRGE